jgi:hypothetical protein
MAGASVHRMEGMTERPTRTCRRCGRTGKNAFRTLVLGDQVRGWVCSHDETCAARTRLKARRQRRGGDAPDDALPWIDKPVCVIGSNHADASLVGQVLTELAGLEVEVLDASMRSLARMTMRDFGCVVVSTAWADPVRFLTDLARRLEVMHRRGVPIVVCYTAGAASPATTDLIRRSGAHAIARPYDASDLIETVGRAAAGQEAPPPRWDAPDAPTPVPL